MRSHRAFFRPITDRRVQVSPLFHRTSCHIVLASYNYFSTGLTAVGSVVHCSRQVSHSQIVILLKADADLPTCLIIATSVL
jgi:hypothetical protein